MQIFCGIKIHSGVNANLSKHGQESRLPLDGFEPTFQTLPTAIGWVVARAQIPLQINLF